jgi:hypothetical protein
MRNVSFDTLAFVADMCTRRFSMVLKPMLDAGVDIGPDSRSNMLDAINLHYRFSCGDLRATDSEIQRLFDIARWLLETDHRNKGLVMMTYPDFDISQSFQENPLPSSAYDDACDLVSSGRLDG